MFCGYDCRQVKSRDSFVDPAKISMRTTLRTWAQGTILILASSSFAFGFNVFSLPFVGNNPDRASVVKIYVTVQPEDYESPWLGGHPSSGSGSGFVIKNRRILTNAHVISDARFIQVQKDGDPRRHVARVVFSGTDCDLAVLEVMDEDFFDDTPPVDFAERLPNLMDEVTVLGYPFGGDRLSVTRGIVSRIDYSTYSHSGVDQHLALQVDAAINPGNSGGPVFFKGKVVGLAFQGITWADNIGFAVPLPVIRHFLDDIEDGTYDGYPELGVGALETRNSGLRKSLSLPQNASGVVVYYVDPFGSAAGRLHPHDVLLAVDHRQIRDDGTILLDSGPVLYSELLERKQVSDTVHFSVWRSGGQVEVAVPLRASADPFIFRNIYDTPPRYLIVGGLVFSPLSRPYLQALKRKTPDASISQLIYFSRYAKIDDLFAGRDEFIVLVRQFPHPVNTYLQDFLQGIVNTVNDVKVRNLKEMKAALGKPRDGFHVIRFEGVEESMVIDAAAAQAANLEIVNEYGVVQTENLGAAPAESGNAKADANLLKD